MATNPRPLLTPDRRDDDADASLRPLALAEFIGQRQARQNLQVFIGAAFYAAAHERRYRDAFVAQRRDADAVACARAQVRLIAQGIHDLANPTPSFRVRRIVEDLGDLAQALAGSVPDAVAKPVAAFAARLADDAPSAALAETCSAIDSWVRDAAAHCVKADPQLDIAGALPLPPAAVALAFLRRPVEALAAD